MATRRKLKFDSPSSPKKTASDEFRSIVEKAKQSVFKSIEMSGEAQALENTVRKVLKDIIEPIEQKLQGLDLRFEERGEGSRGTPLNFLTNPHLNIRPPPLFSGSMGESFGGWLDKFEQYLRLQGLRNLDDEFKIAYLENNLTASALAAFHEVKANITAYEQLIQALKNTFPENRYSDINQLLIYDRKQKPTESVIEYLDNLKKIARSAYPNLNKATLDGILKPIFIRGLESNIRNGLKYRDFATLDESVKTAQYIESQIFREDFIRYNSYDNNTVNILDRAEKAAAAQNDAREIIALIKNSSSRVECDYCSKTNVENNENHLNLKFPLLFSRTFDG